MLTVEPVPVDRLHMDPRNPRRITRRDLDRLKDSITDDPAFMSARPVLARMDGTIYAGNARFAAAKELGWDTVPAIVSDDDERTVMARAIRDNVQFGEWVDEELAGYLHDLGDIAPDLDMDTLGLDASMAEIAGMNVDLSGIADLAAELPTDDVPMSVGGIGTADTVAPEPAASVRPDARLEAAIAAMAGVPVEPHDCDDFGVPLLRADMLATDLPPGLTTWAGADTPHDPDAAYVYNYSPNGTWRDVPLDRCVLSFFTDDRFIERWWANPAYYLARAWGAGVRTAVELDLSPIGHPRVLRLLQLYRSRFIARLMQDMGVKVIPRWPYPLVPEPLDGYNADLVRGLPDHIPVLGFNAQSGTDAEGHADDMGRGFAAWLAEGNTVGVVLAYGARHWPDVAKHVPGVDAVVLPTYLDRRKELGLPWRAN